jgi:hypothetical protein
VLRQQVRRDLLAESKKHKAWKLLCQIPAIGPIRAAVLLGILQTPHRFRTKRQLWNYGGLAIEMHSSADHRSVDGQLQRSRKNVLVRGLNRNCNSRSEEPVQGGGGGGFQQARPVRGVLCGLSGQRHAAGDGAADLGQKDRHDRTDRVEEGSVLRRQSSETTNSLSVSERFRSIPEVFSGGGRGVLETLWFESESQLVS